MEDTACQSKVISKSVPAFSISRKFSGNDMIPHSKKAALQDSLLKFKYLRKNYFAFTAFATLDFALAAACLLM